MSPELAALQHDMAELHGQIEGVLFALRMTAGLIAILCGAIVSLCVYVFVKLSRSHEKLDKQVRGVDRRVVRLEQVAGMEGR